LLFTDSDAGFGDGLDAFPVSAAGSLFSSALFVFIVLAGIFMVL
jgi:hypothetical protein